MKYKEKKIIPLSPVHWIGMVCFLVAGTLLVIDWRLCLMVLIAYGLLFVVTPFMPRLGFFLPVISKGSSGQKAVALTFDDGPDPVATPMLLKLLKEKKIQATFFVSGFKVAQYPQIIKAIIKNGHSIGNHSYHHNPMIYFKGAQAVLQEIEATQNALKPFGVIPCFYRPPVGILSPVLRKPLCTVGMRVVNFSCRAFDFGNKRVIGLAHRILKKVHPDDIILLHDTMPKSEACLQIWIDEIETLLTGLSFRGLSIYPLEKLIGKPVMERSSMAISRIKNG